MAAGFSLLELMVVVAIIAMISAMASPQLMSLMRENAVFDAADQVRASLGETRRYAIDTGIDYEFRFEVNGATAVVLPSESEQNVNEAGQSTTTDSYVRMLVELPEGMRIRADQDVEMATETLDPERFGGLGGSQLAQKAWATAVLFRFDGTSDDFVFRVSDKAGLTCKVTLRGLTGTSKTGLVYQEDD